MTSWDDVVKVASKLMLNTETGALFGQTVKKYFTHTQNQWGSSHRGVYYNAAHALFDNRFCCVQNDTTVQYNTSKVAP